MAVTQSGTFGLTWRDSLKGTIVLDLDLTTHRVALFQNTITPNFDTDTGYGAGTYASGEVTGTGYSAGGTLVSAPTWAVSSGLVVWTNPADPQWSGATFSGARCALWYADALAGNNAICLSNFGSDFLVVSDIFYVHIPATGIFAFDYA